MGFGGISLWQLLIVLAIVVLIFGTKRLKNVGGDVGSAIKSFRRSVKEEESSQETKSSKIYEQNEQSDKSDTSDKTKAE